MVDRPLYHLADGVILSLGTADTFLVNLETGNEIPIDYRYIEALEKVALGWDLAGYESFIPDLTGNHLISEGPAVADPVIRRRLGELNAMYLDGWALELDSRAKAAHEAVLVAHSRRKRFFERVGQCPVLPETALRRALLVGDAEKVGKKKVLCLGDDDLVSIALAALGHEVTVYDIDDFLLTFLRRACVDQGLTMNIVERDLRDPIADAEQGTFDVFLTDPMSNRDCFEIFLSRAFALLKTGGTGYSAVYAPVNRLFRTIADEMKFPIVRWHARHNRYYSKYLRLHGYESDWVEIEKTPETRLTHAPDQYSVPLNLYREDYHQRRRVLMSFLDDIEDIRFATPLYLGFLLDTVEKEADLKPLDRIVHAAQSWTLIHCPLTEGYLTVLVDRQRAQISIDMYPFLPWVEDRLRSLLMAAYKTNAKTSSVATNRACWDVRVR